MKSTNAYACLELAVEVPIELLSLSLHDDPVDLVVDLRGVEHESVHVKEDALDEVKDYCLITTEVRKGPCMWFGEVCSCCC